MESKYDTRGLRTLLLLLCIGCTNQQTIDLPSHISELENLSVYTTDRSPAYQIHFERGQTFGDTDEILFQRMGEFAVDDDGRVLISESAIGYRNIYVFNSDGSYEGRIGSEGDGPGEYRTPANIQIKSNQLYLYDNLLNRVSVYSMNTFSHLYSFVPERDVNGTELSSGMTVQNMLVRTDGHLLIGFYDPPIPNDQRYIHYYLFDQQGTIVSDKIIEQKGEIIFGNRFTVIMPVFNKRPLISMTNDDQVVIADTGEFLVQILNEEGQYIRAFYYPFNNLPLDKETYFDEHSTSDNERANLERVFNNVEFPESWPALESLLIDEESRIWVSTITGNEDIYQWYVLESSGELIAKFDWPKERNLLKVKDGYAYVMESDPDSGIQVVVRYNVTFEM